METERTTFGDKLIVMRMSQNIRNYFLVAPAIVLTAILLASYEGSLSLEWGTMRGGRALSSEFGSLYFVWMIRNPDNLALDFRRISSRDSWESTTGHQISRFIPIILMTRSNGCGILGVRIWFLVFISLVPLSLNRLKMYRYRRQSRAGGCRKCGYDLRFNKTRCPECGENVQESPI